MIYNIRSGAKRRQIPDFLSDVNSNICSFPSFISQYSQWKRLNLKILVKVMEYNIHNGPIEAKSHT